MPAGGAGAPVRKAPDQSLVKKRATLHFGASEQVLHNSVNPLRLRDGRLLLLGQHARFWSHLRVIVLTSKTRLLGMPTSMPSDRGVARCGLRARGEVPRRKLRRCECVYYVGRSRAQVRQRVCVGLLAGGGRGAVPRARPIPTVVLPVAYRCVTLRVHPVCRLDDILRGRFGAAPRLRCQRLRRARAARPTRPGARARSEGERARGSAGPRHSAGEAVRAGARELHTAGQVMVIALFLESTPLSCQSQCAVRERLVFKKYFSQTSRKKKENIHPKGGMGGRHAASTQGFHGTRKVCC